MIRLHHLNNSRTRADSDDMSLYDRAWDRSNKSAPDSHLVCDYNEKADLKIKNSRIGRSAIPNWFVDNGKGKSGQSLTGFPDGDDEGTGRNMGGARRFGSDNAR
jgi:hypothetical protein